jgi:hypothetical protein
MNDAVDLRYLDLFAGYLASLGDDAVSLGKHVEEAALGAEVETLPFVISSLNYVFKSLDLIPDGIDDLGFMDDAFVLRISAAFAVESESENERSHDTRLARLAKEANDVRAFLGVDAPRFEAYVRAARNGTARGRSVDAIVRDPEARRAFVREVSAWARSYEVPTFTRDIKSLIKLKSFLHAKLA